MEYTAKTRCRPSNVAVMRAVTIALLAALAATPLNSQTPDPPRAFLLFIDDLHLDFRETPRTRALMQRLLRQVAREGDTWAVVTTGASSVNLAPTKDLTTLNPIVSRVTGNALKPSERIVAPQASHGVSEMRNRADVAYATAVRAVEGFAAAVPGAALTVFYVSAGYDTRAVPGPQPLLDAAKRARATVIAVRPGSSDDQAPAGVPDAEWRAFLEAAQASLRTLALETGGTTVFAPEDVDPMLRRFTKP